MAWSDRGRAKAGEKNTRYVTDALCMKCRHGKEMLSLVTVLMIFKVFVLHIFGYFL